MMMTHNKWTNRLELGDYLRARRQELGKTQREMASDIGCSAQYLTLLERGGVAAPGFVMLHRVATAYDIAMDDLTGVYFPSVEANDGA